MRPIESRNRADAYKARPLNKGCAIRVMYMDECIANNSMGSGGGTSSCPLDKIFKDCTKIIGHLNRPNYFALVFQALIF